MNLLLGRTDSNVPVAVKEASNPHICITGRSGSGKSYLLKNLLAQASGQGALCLVFDYTGDYRSYAPPNGIRFRKISVSDIALNPLLELEGHSHELLAQQFLSLIHSAFRLGNRANMILRRAVLTYLQEEQSIPSVQKLIERVEMNKAGGRGTDSALEVLELMDSVLTCGTKSVSLDLVAPGITVLDFGDLVDVQLRNLKLSIILNAIWNQRAAASSPIEPPVILLLDEAQTLAWGSGSMPRRILCEGRKYGLAGWFASQWISNKEAVAALEQAYLRIHFRPDEENVRRLSKRLSEEGPYSLKQYTDLVRTLGVGQFILQKPDGNLVKVKGVSP